MGDDSDDEDDSDRGATKRQIRNDENGWTNSVHPRSYSEAQELRPSGTQSHVTSAPPVWLTIEQLCDQFPFFTKSHVYYLVHEKEIPHYKIRGRLFFRVDEILNWIEEQRVCE